MRTTTLFFFLLLLVLIGIKSSATTYYVRAAGTSNSSGLSDAQAWNYATLNSKILRAGDTVLFKRGDTFFGSLTVHPGSALRRVHYGAYGTGNNPVITGMVTVSRWVQHNGNIHYADLRTANLQVLNLVTMDDRTVPMGRYPNSGYLNHTGHSGNTAISGTAVRNIPFNATGAEVVVRKVRWILDRHPVTAHNGTTLSLGTASLYGGSLGYELVDKNGFFIQNHLSTLDREGEWFYDRHAKRLYMVLPVASKTIRYAAVDRLVALHSKSNVSFADLDFEGSNFHGASVSGSNNISFTRCRFYRHGQTGLYGISTADLSVTEGSIEHCLNNGLWVEYGGERVKINGLRTADIGLYAGAGRSGDGAQQAISVAGNNTSISNCTVQRVGYNGIHFDGSNALVERNMVDSFCLVKDDGGGIYTYENEGINVSNRIVRNNIVLHAVGAFAGAESNYYEQYGKAAGVYLDGFSNNTIVSNNVVAHGNWAGIFVNNNSRNQILSNLFFNHPSSILLLQSQRGLIRNMVIRGNECIAKTATQKTLHIKMYAADNPALFGQFAANYYARPIDDNQTIVLEKHYPGGGEQKMHLKQWQTAYGVDLTSGKSSIAARATEDIRFDYNHSPSAKVVSLKGAWKDIHSTVYQSSYLLPSFTGKVVLNTTVSDDNNLLPVNENSFTATRSGSQVLVSWKTAGEGDAYFEVERSRDGQYFTKLGVVQATGSAMEESYQFIDNRPLPSLNFYRLRNVDVKGEFSYTKIVTVKMDGPSSALKAFPNPASSQVYVQLPQERETMQLQVMDAAGRQVHSEQLPAEKSGTIHTLDLRRYHNGTYFLRVNNTTLPFVKR